MNHSSSPDSKSDARDLIDPLWQRKWLLLAIVAAAAVGTYALSSQRSERFRAASRVLVQGSAVQGVLAQQSSSPDRDTADQAQLVTSRAVAQGVISKLRLRETPQDLVDTVTAVPAIDSNFVTVTAERKSAAGAALVANAFVQQYAKLRSSEIFKEIDAAVSDARRQLALLPPSVANAQQRQDLRDFVGRLQTARAVVPSQVRQVDPATPPPRAFSPRPRRDALFALVIAGLFAVALAFLLERFDHRLRSPEEAEALYQTPLMGIVPHIASPTHGVEGGVRIPVGLEESFRWLRTNIDLASKAQPIRSLVITSAAEGEGKSTVVRNLAIAYSEWGRRVCVVEADLRQPSLCELFGLTRAEQGLTSVLTGEAWLAETRIDIDVDDLAGLRVLERIRSAQATTESHGSSQPASNGSEGEAGRLSLIPGGEMPPNPAAVLSAAGPLFSELAAEYDILLIDTPPMLAVSDAAPVVGLADGVLVVGRLGRTRSDAAKRLMTELERVPGANVLGVVVNDLPTERGPGYGYGYGYGRAYAEAR